MVLKNQRVMFRRKREGRTDYRVRYRLLQSNKTRLVVRRSNKHILLQVIDYDVNGDKILFSVHSRELRLFGWLGAGNNTPAAYLCGLLLAKKMRDKNVTQVIPDLGLLASVKGSMLYAALHGVKEGMISIPLSDAVVPDEGRLSGKCIEDFAKHLQQQSPQMFQRQFSSMIKRGGNPLQFVQHVITVKQKICGGVK